MFEFQNHAIIQNSPPDSKPEHALRCASGLISAPPPPMMHPCKGDTKLARKWRRSDVLTPVAALTVLLIAALSGASLKVLLRLQQGTTRTTATNSFVDDGRLMAAQIALVVSQMPETPDGSDWKALSTLIDGLANLAKELQYVEITEGDVTIFHETAGNVLPDGSRQPTLLPMMHNIEISRRRLSVRGSTLPVIVFRRPAGSQNERVIEVGLRQTGIETEERSATQAVASMYRLSLLTVLVGFGSCAALLALMIRREQRREERRREEEHLAFSGVLANGIVHDFRNPMNAVRLDVQMLARESSRGEACRLDRVKDLSSRVTRAVDRMDKVFKEFLYLSRPSPEGSGRMDLVICLRECVEILTPRSEQTGVHILCDLPETQLWIDAAAGAIRRATVNVLNNALQYSTKGESVDVTAKVNGSVILVDIMDRGPGIPRAERNHIFEMFVTHRPEGTGLGLFLARTAVEKCGGRITAHERDGGGTRMRIQFPAAKATKDPS